MRELPRSTHRGAHRLDPDYAPTVEVFDNLTHQRIHAGVSLLNPVVLQTGRQTWQEAATGLSDAVAAAHTEIRAAVADGWRGAAAGQAAAAVRDFEQAGRDLADVLSAVGQRLGRAGDAAETLRAGIAEPSGVEPDLAAALLSPAAALDNIAVQRGAEDARQDAVRVMEAVYAGAFIPTGSAVPAFPELPDIGTEAANTPLPAPARPERGESSETPTGQPPARPGGTPAPGPAAGVDEAPAPAAAAAVSGSPAVFAAPAAVEVAVTAPEQMATTATAAAEPLSAPGTPSAQPAPTGPTAHQVSSAAPTTAMPGPPATATASTSQDQRKREESRDDAGSETVTGMGAGAIGGLMGGALASDAVRSGTGVTGTATPPTRTRRAEDDEPHFPDEELSFLEPGEEAGELVGAMDPTTPPVLGEWAEPE